MSKQDHAKQVPAATEEFSRREFLQKAGQVATGLVATGLGAASCSRTPKPVSTGATRSARKTVVNFWFMPNMDQQEEVYRQSLQSFLTAHPEIEVKFEVIPWDQQVEKFVAAVAAGHPPEISYITQERFYQFAAEGLLEPLEDHVPTGFETDFLDYVWKLGEYRDHLYVVPNLVSTNATYYNAAMYEAAGLDPNQHPATWDDFYEVCRALTDPQKPQWGWSWFTNSTSMYNTFPFFWSAGAEILNPEGTQAAFNTPEGLDALTWLTKMVQEVVPLGQTSPDYQEINHTFFLELQAAHDTTWGGLREKMREQNPDVPFGIFKNPKRQNIAAYSGVGLYGIWKKAPAKEAAFQVLFEGLMGKEALEVISRGIGAFSPRLSSAEMYGDDPIMQVLWEQIRDHGHLYPVTTQTAAMEKILVQGCQAAMLGLITPQEALADMEAKVNAALVA